MSDDAKTSPPPKPRGRYSFFGRVMSAAERDAETLAECPKCEARFKALEKQNPGTQYFDPLCDVCKGERMVTMSQRAEWRRNSSLPPSIPADHREGKK